MRAFLLLALVGALIVGVPLYLEHEQRTSELSDLAQAAIQGRVEEASRFLTAGADPNEPLVDGLRPLEQAVRGGHLDVVALLLAHGAQIPVHAKAEENAADVALAGGHDAVLRLLLRAGAPLSSPTELWMLAPTPESGPILFDVVIDGDEELALALVQAGFPLDEVRALDGMSPLSAAAITGNVPITRLLLDQGTNATTARTHFGRTPLHHAALGGVPEIVEDVLVAGADVSAADQLGWTPLHLAARFGHGRAVRVLAAPAAAAKSLDARDAFGWTPLMCAVSSGERTAVDAILSQGADVQAASTSGRTALHIAAERGHEALYERLVVAGANEGTRDTLGSTPAELRSIRNLPLGDLEARQLDEPIVRAGWFRADTYASGRNMEFVAWGDGVVLFSELLSSYPWTTVESLQVGRIPAARARRLAVELEESGLFRHPVYAGPEEMHAATRYVARRLPLEGEKQVPLEQGEAKIYWRYEPETSVTLRMLWRDVRGILASARPTLTEPLIDHFVDRRGSGEGTFRGISWTNE